MPEFQVIWEKSSPQFQNETKNAIVEESLKPPLTFFLKERDSPLAQSHTKKKPKSTYFPPRHSST